MQTWKDEVQKESFVNNELIERLLVETKGCSEADFEAVMKKAEKQVRLSLEDVAILLNVEDSEKLNRIFNLAKSIKERVYGNRGFLLPELVKDGGQQPLVTLIVTGDSDPYCKQSAINYSDYMTSHGINHIFYIRSGAHEVSVWNNGLYNFIRRIF